MIVAHRSRSRRGVFASRILTRSAIYNNQASQNLIGENCAARAIAPKMAVRKCGRLRAAPRSSARLGRRAVRKLLLRDLMRLGMDVARLNFSHGTHEEHGRVIERLRRAADKEERTICILQDLQGPKIRTGELKGHTHVTLKAGSKVTITPREIEGTASADFDYLPRAGAGSAAGRAHSAVRRAD